VADWPRIARRIRVPTGFVVAGVYLWFAAPSAGSLALGAVLIIPGLLLRGLASGYVQKNEALTTGGPYAHTRNPLYLGSFVLALGFALSGRNVWVGAAMVAVFLAVYLPVIRAEESYLQHQFSEFADYARQVPRLLPRLTPWARREGGFSWTLYWKHREYNATLGSAVMMAALAAKWHWMSA